MTRSNGTIPPRRRRKRGSLPEQTRLLPRCPSCNSWRLDVVSSERLDDDSGELERFCKCKTCGATCKVFLI